MRPNPNYPAQLSEPDTRDLGNWSVEDLASDLLKLDRKGLKTLSERINNANGLTQILVHPLWERNRHRHAWENETYEEAKRNDPKIELVETALTHIMEKGGEAIPLFVFEVKDYLEKTKTQFDNKNVYWLPTEMGRSTPKFSDQFNPSGKSYLDEDVSWEYAIRIFKQVGIKEIAIGGIALNEIPEMKAHGGCVGEAAKNLKRHFTVNVSLPTYPYEWNKNFP